MCVCVCIHKYIYDFLNEYYVILYMSLNVGSFQVMILRSKNVRICVVYFLTR